MTERFSHHVCRNLVVPKEPKELMRWYQRCQLLHPPGHMPSFGQNSGLIKRSTWCLPRMFAPPLTQWKPSLIHKWLRLELEVFRMIVSWESPQVHLRWIPTNLRVDGGMMKKSTNELLLMPWVRLWNQQPLLSLQLPQRFQQPRQHHRQWKPHHPQRPVMLEVVFPLSNATCRLHQGRQVVAQVQQLQCYLHLAPPLCPRPKKRNQYRWLMIG